MLPFHWHPSKLCQKRATDSSPPTREESSRPTLVSHFYHTPSNSHDHKFPSITRENITKQHYRHYNHLQHQQQQYSRMMMQYPLEHLHYVDTSATHHSVLSRPRSQSIMIKKTRTPEETTTQSDHSNEQMYDWATWRMYHRITNARRTSKVAPTPTVTSQRQQQSYQSRISSSRPSPALTSIAEYPETEEHQLPPEQHFDGEVFELEI